MPFSLPSSSHHNFLLKPKTTSQSSSANPTATSSLAAKTKSPSSLFSFKAAAEKASDRFRSKKSKELRQASKITKETVLKEPSADELKDKSFAIVAAEKEEKSKSTKPSKPKLTSVGGSKKLVKNVSNQKDSVESSESSCVSTSSSSANSMAKSIKYKSKPKRASWLTTKIDEESLGPQQETDDANVQMSESSKKNIKTTSKERGFPFSEDTQDTNEDEEAEEEMQDEDSEEDLFVDSYTDQIIEEEENDEEGLAEGKYKIFIENCISYNICLKVSFKFVYHITLKSSNLKCWTNL